ncbi:MAG: glycosyltransferase family 4 protein [Verrucomicrobiae bacterium]|nr:glycosyltransferase family 4 protein [Verrucomicrobiae bacterium]
MVDSTPKLLFLNHAATRNGASILLLAFLRWLGQNTKFTLEVLTTSGGPLVDDFRAVAKMHLWQGPRILTQALPQRWSRWFRPRLEQMFLRAFLKGRKYDLIYANTAATAPALMALHRRTQAVLWHIHELRYALRATLSPQVSALLLPKITRYIAASESVADTLREDYRVEGRKIDLVHEFVAVSHQSGQDRARNREIVLRDFGWPAEAFVVGGCGALGWRKGTDVFLRVAQLLRSTYGLDRARFLWVGGGDEGEMESLRFNHDLELLGLRDQCVRVQSTAEVGRYYSAMNVFALTSREDPFPLVMLEAGAHELPLVCFANSGGGPEFARNGTGRVVPYLDLAAFASELATLFGEPSLCQRLGAEAARRVREHHTAESQCPKLLASMKRCLEVAR